MDFELDKRNMPNEKIQLKEGVDPNTIDWKKVRQELTSVSEGIQEMNEMLDRIFARYRERCKNENK
jgi:hypothetical protein